MMTMYNQKEKVNQKPLEKMENAIFNFLGAFILLSYEIIVLILSRILLFKL